MITKCAGYYSLGLVFLLILNPAISFAGSSDQNVDLQQATHHKATGDQYLKQGKTSLAINEYQKAIAFNPDSPAVYFNLAIAYYAEKNLAKAAFALEKLVETEPDDVEARYNLACLRLYQQDVEKARFHLQKAKICSTSAPEFLPLIDKAFEFLDELKNLDLSTQDVIFFLLQQGFPTVSAA